MGCVLLLLQVGVAGDVWSSSLALLGINSPHAFPESTLTHTSQTEHRCARLEILGKYLGKKYTPEHFPGMVGCAINTSFPCVYVYQDSKSLTHSLQARPQCTRYVAPLAPKLAEMMTMMRVSLLVRRQPMKAMKH